MKLLPAALLVALAVVPMGCSCPCGKQAKPAEARAVTPGYPVIARLVSRRQTVTISAGPGSALYSVQSPEGKTLVAFVTLDELRERHPEQYRFLQPVVAAKTGEAYAGIGSAE